MKKQIYKIEINAPVSMVFNMMLGINNKKTYEQWTAAFNPTSTYEGGWEKGNKILFIGVDENGKRGGMISRIAENVPDQFISIQHYGMLDGDKEITDGPLVEKWAGGHENYTYTTANNTTTVVVEIDVVEDYLDYFNDAYPKALKKLKEIIEDK